MKVRRRTLLWIAALVWAAGGANIARIGILAYAGNVTGLRLLGSAAVFVIFQWMVFGKLVRKHTRRIVGYGQTPQWFFRFFDAKSFVIMAVMMTGGILLRNVAPKQWIAVFYTGLGLSLLLAGLLFGRQALLLQPEMVRPCENLKTNFSANKE